MKKSHKLLHKVLVNIFRILLIVMLSPVYAQKKGEEAVPEVRDLSTILDTGYILQDLNEDSVIDYINARIFVPENPSETHLVCASNIAARLGYETSGMDLDLVHSCSSLPSPYPMTVISIDIPPEISSKQSGLDLKGINILSLAPGQGRVRFYGPEIYPDHGVVSIRGADDTGLIAAANFFAGRYPDLWELKGKTFVDVKRKFKEFLEERDLRCNRIHLDYVNVDAHRPGILKLFLVIEIDKKSDFELAVKALRGKDTRDDEDKLLKVTDLEFKDVHSLAVEVVSPDAKETIVLTPQKEWATEAAKDRAPSPVRSFSLWKLYRIDGIFQDTNEDYVPDHVMAYVSVGGVENMNTVANLTARVGLESAGIKIPLVRVAGEEENPERYGFPILFGGNHYMIHRIREENKLYGLSDTSRAGYIQFVSNAFNDKNGLVISANDEAGLDAISEYVSERMPYLWEYGKGNFHLRDIETDVKDFFQIRKAPGQVGLALYKLETWLERLEGKEIDSISVELATEKTPAGLEEFIRELLEKTFGSAAPCVEMIPTGFGIGRSVFEEEFEIPWEVDCFWEYFRNDALPRFNERSRGKIRVMVSESPEVRQRLKDQIEEELRMKGVPENAIDVVVLCAYKQGYSWLYDEVLPRIRKKRVGRIEITYHTLKESEEIRWQSIATNTRWLQEIYPIDAVLARELKLPDSLITFHPTQQKNPVYTVRVFDKKGRRILMDSFTPKYVVRPFFDLFPEYESVRVTTGWVTVEIDGDTLLDRRIKTDPEKFWDHLQTVTYRKIIDYVMDIQDGRPSSDNAPYFDEFRVYLTMSEPNYRIGIDEEVISSVEALHEDIYFETLTLFNLIGGRYGAGAMSFPGRILPYIQPPVDGKAGNARIEFTGKEKGWPHLVMTYRERDKEPVKQRYDLNRLKIPDPKLTGIWVNPGEAEVSQLMFEVAANDSIDRYEEYKMRASENVMDREIIPIPRLIEMVRILNDLHRAGIFQDELSYDRVANMLFRVVLEDSLEYGEFVNLPRSKNPECTDNPELLDDDFRVSGEKIVQWENPIAPEEAASIMARLNKFPNINVYYTANSFLDQPVFAMDLFPPYKSKFVSQAKLNALKPTLFISGRQHANEVSSTSHILRLAELVATDTSYARYLRKVNLVLHPITNIDGARLGVEMHRMNPHFMLHAAYRGPLGGDVDSENPHYPESQVRGILRETWLPDVYLNPHGYPSHEWVQYFAGYSAWVRSRKGGQRTWWSPRGWFIPGFRWIEDKKYPEHKKVSFAILDSIATSITALPDVMDVNRRMYKRYKKYGIQDRENFREYFHHGILVNAALRGRKMDKPEITGPRVTYFSLTTEAPDETAYSRWMRMCCRAGLTHTTAVFRYLAEGVNRIEHEAKEYRDCISRSVFRKRPVLPPERGSKKQEEEGKK